MSDRQPQYEYRRMIRGAAFRAVAALFGGMATVVSAADEPPSNLRSYRRDGVGQTLVEFHSPTIRKLYEAREDMQKVVAIEGTTFRLYRSIDGGTTWLLSCSGTVGIFDRQLISDYGYAKPPDIGILPDSAANAENKYRPASFRIAQVFTDKDGKEREVLSPVLPPSYLIRVAVSVSVGRGGGSRREGDTVLLDPENSNRTDLEQSGFGVSMSMDLQDQDHVFPRVHFEVEWNGRTWHGWGRENGIASVALPLVFGVNTLTVTGEGAYGGRGSASVKIAYNPPDAAGRQAAAARDVEEDDKVRRYKAEYEQIPGRLNGLQRELEGQQSPERQRDLRYEIVKLQEIPIRLEEARLEATLARAQACAVAGEWTRAVELANAYFRERPAWIERYLGYLDREREADLATRKGDELGERKVYLENFKKNMETGQWDVFERSLQTLVRLAGQAGDYTRCIDFVQKREMLLQRQKTQDAVRDLASLHREMSRYTAVLDGDLVRAESYWERAGGEDPMPWGPPPAPRTGP